MERTCELCGFGKIKLQFAPNGGNWFPSQCRSCEMKGKRGACGLTHDAVSLKEAIEDALQSTDDDEYVDL